MPEPPAHSASMRIDPHTRLACLSALLLLTLAACTGRPPAATSTPAAPILPTAWITPTVNFTTGISGVAEVGPTDPATRWMRPVQVPIAVFDSQGKLLIHVQPDAHGWFSAELPPGTYGLKAEFPADQVPFGARGGWPLTVTVSAGQVTPVRLWYDTSIR